MAKLMSYAGVLAIAMFAAAVFGIVAAQPAAAPAQDCTSVVLTLTDCLGYVQGSVKTPPAACCSELSAVVISSPQCLCLLFNTSFTSQLGLNVTIAQQLPAACKVQTPPTSLCSAIGVPVPGPVSAAAPGAVTPAAAATPPPSATSPPSSAPTSPSSPRVSAPVVSPTAAAPAPASSPSSVTPSSSPTPGAAVPVVSTPPTGAPSSAEPSPTTPPTTSPPSPAPSSALRTLCAGTPLALLMLLSALLV